MSSEATEIHQQQRQDESATTTSTDLTMRADMSVDSAQKQGENEEGAVVKKKLVKKKKRRPARPQVDPATFKPGQLPEQTGTIFNIWYNKWSGGDREDKYISKAPAQGRCNIARDSGYTKADSVPGAFFCLFFARGLCPHGQNCEYLHRLPVLTDIFNPNVDCFGRDKHADYRDDMGGVGSFLRQNRTLYVGRIHVSDDIEEVVARHFAEWGQIERIRVLNSRGVGFVTYSNEANAQFAKEAMAHQSLDHNEILNVRWATVDPNPMAAAREKRKIEEQAAEAIRAALPAAYVAEIEGRAGPGGKKRRMDGGFELEGYEMPEEVWFAREREREALEAAGGGEQMYIEAAERAEEEEKKESGILGGQTLERLREVQRKAQGSGIKMASAKPVAPAGPLVAYGSDDDSD